MDQRRAENEFKKSFLRSYRRSKRNVAVLSDQIAELRAAKMGVSCGSGTECRTHMLGLICRIMQQNLMN